MQQLGTLLFFIGCMIQLGIVFFDPSKKLKTFFQVVGMMLIIPGVLMFGIVECFG